MGGGRGRTRGAGGKGPLTEVEFDGDEREGVDGEVKAVRERDVDVRAGEDGETEEGGEGGKLSSMSTTVTRNGT